MAEGEEASLASGTAASYRERVSGYSLEEDAARRDALGLASKPDLPPLTQLEPLVGVGMLQPGAGAESTLYLPVERQEMVSAQNLAVAFRRLDVMAADAERTHIITDVVVLESVGDEPPLTINLGAKYSVVKVDLLPESQAENAAPPHVWLCVKSEPAGECTEAPLVDLAVVYGSVAEGDMAFDMSGGFETLELPPKVRDAYGARIFVCLKREGSGATFAEQIAAKAAAEAAAALDSAADSIAGSSVGDLEKELEDEVLDTSLTPAQIKQLEEKRAAEARSRAIQLEAHEEAARQEQYAVELRQRLEDAIEFREELARNNDELQVRAWSVLSQSADPLSPLVADPQGSGGDGFDAERAYGDALNGVVETEEKHRRMASEFERVTRDLQSKLDEKEGKAAEIYDTFRAFKQQIALQAVNSRSGKGLSKKEIEAFTSDERARDDELSKVRLRNTTLRMALKKLELLLKAKDELAEGLHVVDYEQLKIENATLVEKIEDRTGDLAKLRKKKTGSVEVLSHVREKLFFTRDRVAETRLQLANLDQVLGESRDALTRIKRERDILKRANAGHKNDQGFTKSDKLVLDFENRKRTLATAKDKIQEARDKFMNLSAYVEANGA